MKVVVNVIKTLRLKDWIKNVFIFAPMIFSFHMFQMEYVKTSFIAFILFSFITGSVYIFNDIIDKDYDKNHPVKKKRPIASGNLSVFNAYISLFVILFIDLILIYKFNLKFFYLSVFYLILNLLYSLVLKKVVILDIMVISVGFVLRVMIGGYVNNIYLSPWILITTFLLAIFLALIKRRQEIVRLGVNSADTRKILKKYNLEFVNQLISITTALTIIAYIIYVIMPGIQKKFHSENLYFTVPFVIFGLFRYLYLTYVKDMGESPADIILSDSAFTFNIILWVGVFIYLVIG